MALTVPNAVDFSAIPGYPGADLFAPVLTAGTRINATLTPKTGTSDNDSDRDTYMLAIAPLGLDLSQIETKEQLERLAAKFGWSDERISEVAHVKGWDAELEGIKDAVYLRRGWDPHDPESRDDFKISGNSEMSQAELDRQLRAVRREIEQETQGEGKGKRRGRGAGAGDDADDEDEKPSKKAGGIVSGISAFGGEDGFIIEPAPDTAIAVTPLANVTPLEGGTPLQSGLEQTSFAMFGAAADTAPAALNIVSAATDQATENARATAEATAQPGTQDKSKETASLGDIAAAAGAFAGIAGIPSLSMLATGFQDLGPGTKILGNREFAFNGGSSMGATEPAQSKAAPGGGAGGMFT